MLAAIALAPILWVKTRGWSPFHRARSAFAALPA